MLGPVCALERSTWPLQLIILYCIHKKTPQTSIFDDSVLLIYAQRQFEKQTQTKAFKITAKYSICSKTAFDMFAYCV